MNNDVAVFADVANLYYCIKQRFNQKLMYSTYLETAVGENNLFHAFAYSTQDQRDAYKFGEALRHGGFEPKFQCTLHSIQQMALAMDVVRLVPRVGLIILGSSDPIFLPLIQWVREQGVRVVLFACGIPREMREAANECREIDAELLQGAIEIIT